MQEKLENILIMGKKKIMKHSFVIINHLSTENLIIFTDITYEYNEEASALKDAIDAICAQAEQAANDGYQFLILSDRNVNADRVPFSTVLACGAVHHHLIMTRLRSKCGIILETGKFFKIN